MAKKSQNEVSGWTGWVAFAGFMLYLAGFFHLVAGLAALLTDKVYVVGEEYIWTLDYTTWGWLHLIAGALAVWAASSLMQGKAFGRTVAVLVAMGSAIANMVFVPIYPFWALLIIAVNVFVIYSVVVHGGELKD